MEDERIRSDSFDAEYLVRISDSVRVLGTPVVQVIFACVHKHTNILYANIHDNKVQTITLRCASDRKNSQKNLVQLLRNTFAGVH